MWYFIIGLPPAPIIQPPLLPAGAAATAALTPSPTGDAGPTVLGQLVVSADRTLGPQDRSFDDDLMTRLGSDGRHVESVMPTWSDPISADIATSADHRGAYGLVWLKGAPGSAEAGSAVRAVEETIATTAAPPGVRAYLSGPATAFPMPSSPSWSTTVAVLAAALIVVGLAVQRICRPRIRLRVLAGATAATVFAAAPLVYALAATGRLALSPLSVALGVVLTICTALDFTLVITRNYHRLRRSGTDHHRALADAYAALLRHVAIAAPVLIAMLSAALFLHTPLLREITVPSAIGMAIALLAVVTLVPGLISHSSHSPAWTDSWAAGDLMPPNRGRLYIAVATVCALVIGATAISVHNSRPDMPAEGGPFALSQLMPDVVTIDSDRDLRTPNGLASINAISRKLQALPGVVRVQSAGTPAGMPWNQATFAYQAGHLGSRAQQLLTSAAAQFGPVKSLSVALDNLSRSIDRARGGGTTGDLTRAAADVGAGVQGLQQTAAAVVGAVAPIQEWMQGFPNCTGNAACATAQRLVAPFGGVLRAVRDLGRDASAMFTDGSPGSGAPDLLGQLQAVIARMRTLVPGLSRAIDTVLPQIGSLATSMKSIGQSFGSSTGGSFYFPGSAINGMPYRAIRDAMFSTDGHRTRLLVYGALDNAALPLWQRPSAISGVLAIATRDGMLGDRTVTVSGTGVAALALRDLARHDAAALTLCFLVATALAALIMIRHRRTAALLAGLALTFTLGGAAVWISVTDIVVGEITWLAVLLAMAVAGPLAVHHHIRMVGGARTRHPFRQPANVLCLAAITFGLAIWMAPGDSLLHRAGLLMAIVLSINTATNSVSRRHIAQVPAAIRALWTAPRPSQASRPVAAVPERLVPSAAVCVRPADFRPRINIDGTASRSASRRAKALLRQQHWIYLEGPVPEGRRPRFATGYAEVAVAR